MDHIKLPLKVLVPLVLLVAAGLSAYIALTRETARADRELNQSALTDMRRDMAHFQEEVEYLLRRGDVARIAQQLATLGADEHVTGAYLTDDWGKIIASMRVGDTGVWAASVMAETDPEEAAQRTAVVGRVLDTLAGEVRLSTIRDSVYGLYPVRMADSEDVLHPDRIGLLFIENSLADRRAAAYHLIQRHVTTSSALLVGLAFCLWLFFHYALGRRVAGVMEATNRFAAGDLSARTSVRGGDEIGRVASAFNDMAGQISDNREQLAESEERVLLLLNSAAEAIFGMDRAGLCTFVNPACARLLGYENVNDLLGRDIHGLIHHSHADGTPYPEEECHLQQALQNGGEVHIDCEVLWRADGTCFPAEYWSHPILRRGENVGSVVTFIDITERRKAEDALQRAHDNLEVRVRERTRDMVLANRQLKDEIAERKRVEAALIEAKEEAEIANQAKSEFLSRMSHELRTPMNAILGFSQILDSDPTEPLSNSQKESVAEILSAGYHLLELINEVLDLSRIDAGQLPINLEAVPISEAVDQALAQVGTLARKNGVTLNDHSAVMHHVAVRADRKRLAQVLVNLLSNGVKYNRAGGAVSMSCSEPLEGFLRIEVADTGCGISKDQQSRLFQPFTRLTDDRSTVSGTGIGLTVTKRLVELMDGRIGFSSVPGEGSRFYVDLPRADGVEGVDVAASSTVSPRKTAPRAATLPEPVAHDARTVLYIEDNSANVALVRRILAHRSDIHMLSATDAGSGLSVAREEKPDVVLMDIHLPDMDGFELLSRLRAAEETAGTPVLAFSGDSLPQDVERGLKAGFFRYLTKPADIRTLLSAIDDAMPKA
ncbi:MAG: ATP-binding protein [Leptospirillia bacterium]